MDYVISGYRVERFYDGRFLEFGFFPSSKEALAYCNSHPISIESIRETNDTGFFIVPEKRFIPTQLSIFFD